jgi:hypothetical protein
MSDIQTHFEEFDKENPWVYKELVKLLHEARDTKGYPRWSVDGAFHVLRWERAGSTVYDPNSQWKLNDHYTSRYARKILKYNPDLEGFIRTRPLRS